MIGREKIMGMTKRVGQEKGVTVDGARDEAELSLTKTIVQITVEHPLLIIQYLLSKLEPNNLRVHACRMAQEGFLWVGGSR